MNMINSIKQHLTNKTVVHASMLAFAVTSTLNIAGFFRSTDHNTLVAASIGLALGGGLMAVSIYLSRQEFGKGLSFWTLLVATVAMALLSGQIQSMGYQKHGLDIFTANLLGFAPPIVAEVLLALSVSLAERTERERAQRDSKQFIKDSVAESMTSAFRNVDASRIQKHIERQVDGVIRAFVDDALGEMMAELNAGRTAESVKVVDNERQALQSDAVKVTDHFDDTKAIQPVTVAPQVASNIPVLDANALDNGRQVANENKRNQRQENLEKLVDLLSTITDPDAINKADIARQLGVSRQTVVSYFDTLQDSGRIHINGAVKVN